VVESLFQSPFPHQLLSDLEIFHIDPGILFPDQSLSNSSRRLSKDSFAQARPDDWSDGQKKEHKKHFFRNN
jgi:hypothetical protein